MSTPGIMSVPSNPAHHGMILVLTWPQGRRAGESEEALFVALGPQQPAQVDIQKIGGVELYIRRSTLTFRGDPSPVLETVNSKKHGIIMSLSDKYATASQLSSLTQKLRCRRHNGYGDKQRCDACCDVFATWLSASPVEVPTDGRSPHFPLPVWTASQQPGAPSRRHEIIDPCCKGNQMQGIGINSSSGVSEDFTPKHLHTTLN